jgi:K+-transporting ATPase ATPase B chain
VAQPGDVRGLRRQHPDHRLWVQALAGQGGTVVAERPGFILAIALWLWFTVLFANFAEALAEGRSKAQAASLRGLKKETWAKKLKGPRPPPSGIRSRQRTCAKATVVLVRPAKPSPATAK